MRGIPYFVVVVCLLAAAARAQDPKCFQGKGRLYRAKYSPCKGEGESVVLHAALSNKFKYFKYFIELLSYSCSRCIRHHIICTCV